MGRASIVLCATVGLATACGGSSAEPSAIPPVGSVSTTTAGTSGDSTGASSPACTFFHEDEVATLFDTTPQQTFDPYGVGGPTSNCLWKADAGGKQYLLQVAFFDGEQHYAASDKSGSANLAGFGDKGFIHQGDIAGISLEFVRANKTYFFLFSIAKTLSPTQNDANAKSQQLLALIKSNLPRL